MHGTALGSDMLKEAYRRSCSEIQEKESGFEKTNDNNASNKEHKNRLRRSFGSPRRKKLRGLHRLQQRFGTLYRWGLVTGLEKQKVLVVMVPHQSINLT
jgi:hypothetical protein